MKYKNATSIQRFFAFFIDSFLIYVVSGLILICIPAYNTYSEIFLDRYNDLMISFTTTEVDTIFMKELMVSGLIITGLNIAVLAVLTFLYYVVLPYFWKSQTIGRLALGLRVVTLDEKDPTFGQFILREMVGGYFVYRILGISGVFYLVTFIMSVSKGRSLIDYIGKTRLVDIRYPEKVVDSVVSGERDYVDAYFKDVSEEEANPGKETPNEEQGTDYKVI